MTPSQIQQVERWLAEANKVFLIPGGNLWHLRESLASSLALFYATGGKLEE